jgi:hypothetical protein
MGYKKGPTPVYTRVKDNKKVLRQVLENKKRVGIVPHSLLLVIKSSAFSLVKKKSP